MAREQIEKEVRADLGKSYKQLLDDIHDELLYDEVHEKGRGGVENIKHSLKRISSLFGKIGMESEKTTKALNRLTACIIILMLIQIILSIFCKK